MEQVSASRGNMGTQTDKKQRQRQDYLYAQTQRGWWDNERQVKLGKKRQGKVMS